MARRLWPTGGPSAAFSALLLYNNDSNYFSAAAAAGPHPPASIPPFSQVQSRPLLSSHVCYRKSHAPVPMLAPGLGSGGNHYHWSSCCRLCFRPGTVGIPWRRRTRGSSSTKLRRKMCRNRRNRRRAAADRPIIMPSYASLCGYTVWMRSQRGTLPERVRSVQPQPEVRNNAAPRVSLTKIDAASQGTCLLSKCLSEEIDGTKLSADGSRGGNHARGRLRWRFNQVKQGAKLSPRPASRAGAGKKYPPRHRQYRGAG